MAATASAEHAARAGAEDESLARRGVTYLAARASPCPARPGRRGRPWRVAAKGGPTQPQAGPVVESKEPVTGSTTACRRIFLSSRNAERALKRGQRGLSAPPQPLRAQQHGVEPSLMRQHSLASLGPSLWTAAAAPCFGLREGLGLAAQHLSLRIRSLTAQRQIGRGRPPRGQPVLRPVRAWPMPGRSVRAATACCLCREGSSSSAERELKLSACWRSAASTLFVCCKPVDEAAPHP